MSCIKPIIVLFFIIGLAVDANGCDRAMRNVLEDKCDEDFERIITEARLMKDDDERAETICCALEDLEKCILRAFDKANCGNDKAVVRENMKAARLFTGIVENVRCDRFRGQCGHYNSAPSVPVIYIVVFGAVLIALIETFL